jgi:hypothetical protein
MYTNKIIINQTADDILLQYKFKSFMQMCIYFYVIIFLFGASFLPKWVLSVPILMSNESVVNSCEAKRGHYGIPHKKASGENSSGEAINSWCLLQE